MKPTLAQVENHQRVILGLDESSVSYQKLFRYPPGREWVKLQPKIVTIEEKAEARESVVEKDIKRKLEESQSVSFVEQTPFMDVLKTLSALSAINFILTKEAQQAVRDAGI